MMRLRRASAIAALSLLASAATAYAECAWVLWEQTVTLNSSGPLLPDVSDVVATRRAANHVIAQNQRSVSVGAAPKGDAKAVATRIIKFNFPECKSVSTAMRLADGSIRANCDGADYRVFTVYSATEGKMLEVAMNCTVAKRLLQIDCY